jgi:S-adenosyl-L-methionine hydrolase (adenosine-forming)
MAIVALTTDFGTTDPWVGIMKGVIAARAPGATVIDVTHGIPPQDVLAGALVLRHAVPYFPLGTVHLAVVDPGVGGPRRALCVETARALFVGPDNGLLSLAAPASEVRTIVELRDERFHLTPRSATFHGRDVFAPVAAALARGTSPAELGPEVPAMERLTLPQATRADGALRGQVVYVDHFGNLVTNLSEVDLSTFPSQRLSISIRDVRLTDVARSYADVAPGEPVAVVNSWGLLEIAVRDGSARATLGGRVGDPVEVEGR